MILNHFPTPYCLTPFKRFSVSVADHSFLVGVVVMNELLFLTVIFICLLSKQETRMMFGGGGCDGRKIIQYLVDD